MRKTSFACGVVLLSGLMVAPALAQDATIDELNQIVRQIASGGDPCPYLPRLKVLVNQLASENPEIFSAMRPMLEEMNKPDDSCAPPAPPVRQSPPPPPAPIPQPRVVTMPKGTVFSLPAGSSPGSVLDGNASDDVIRQVNNARASQRGLNQVALPPGNVTVQPTGDFSLTASGNRQFEVRKSGALVAVSTPDGKASVLPGGRIGAVHLASADISHGPHGESIATSRRSDGTMLVSRGAGNGYLEQTISSQGHRYLERTYVNDGHQSTTFYALSGSGVPAYIPPVTYAPAFYDWVNGSWSDSRPKSWPWIADQVVRQFAAYFTPDADYVNPVQWLTDFVISRALRSTPAADAPAAPDDGAASNSAPVSSDLKAALAEQVRADIVQEKASGPDPAGSAAQEPASAFDRVYVVSTGMDVPASTDDTCWVSSGDILTFDHAVAGTQNLVLKVAGSQLADCAAGTSITLDAAVLRDMHNELHAGIDDGLAALRSKQGADGWPAAPQDTIAPPPRPAMSDVPPVKADVASMLDSQQKDSAAREQQFLQAAFASSAQ